MPDLSTTPAATVRAWHEALNRGDHEAVLALSTDGIEIAGPRGRAAGRAVLRQWLEATRVELHPRRYFARGAVVVVEELGVWRAPDTGAIEGEAEVASVFRVEEGRVAYYARHDALSAALGEAGLDPSDAVGPDGEPPR